METQNLNKEQELFEKAKKDKRYFDDLYKYFVNDVYRFSYSILNNQHDAEDITSQTFIEFYKKIDQFEWRNISLKYWLFKTARNFAYKKNNQVNFDEFEDDFSVKEEPEISFVDEIMNKDLIEKVKDEINKLNPVEQEIINLRIWEGMQFKDIANIQNAIEDTTKKRFYRSIEKIKKSLEEKKIRSAITFPFVFTAISKVGESSAYAAPAGLLIASAGSLFLANTSMSGLTAFLTTKAGAAALVGLAALTGVGATVTGYEISKRNLEDSSKIVSATPSPTPTISTTPTASITSVPTSASTPTIPSPTPTQYTYVRKSFTDKVAHETGTGQGKLSFEVPTFWDVQQVKGSTGCSQYSVTNNTTKLNINNVTCDNWLATSSLPDNYEVVKINLRWTDDGRDQYLIRYYDSNTKSYIYESVWVESGKKIASTDKKVASFGIRDVDPTTSGVIALRASLTSQSSDDIKATDKVILSLKLSDIKSDPVSW